MKGELVKLNHDDDEEDEDDDDDDEDDTRAFTKNVQAQTCCFCSNICSNEREFHLKPTSQST